MALSVAVVALTTALIACLWHVMRVVGTNIPATPPDPDWVTTEDLAMVSSRFHAEIESLTYAISEGIARTDRAEKRVQKTVSSARRLLRENGLEHAPLEAEVAELHEGDADRGPEGELPPLPESVAPARRVTWPGASPDFLSRLGAL